MFQSSRLFVLYACSASASSGSGTDVAPVAQDSTTLSADTITSPGKFYYIRLL